MTIQEHLAVCQGKVTYYSLSDAIAAEDYVWDKYHSYQRRYRCPFCRHLHLKTVTN